MECFSVNGNVGDRPQMELRGCDVELLKKASGRKTKDERRDRHLIGAVSHTPEQKEVVVFLSRQVE